MLIPYKLPSLLSIRSCATEAGAMFYNYRCYTSVGANGQCFFPRCMSGVQVYGSIVMSFLQFSLFWAFFINMSFLFQFRIWTLTLMPSLLAPRLHGTVVSASRYDVSMMWQGVGAITFGAELGQKKTTRQP